LTGLAAVTVTAIGLHKIYHRGKAIDEKLESLKTVRSALINMEFKGGPEALEGENQKEIKYYIPGHIFHDDKVSIRSYHSEHMFDAYDIVNHLIDVGAGLDGVQARIATCFSANGIVPTSFDRAELDASTGTSEYAALAREVYEAAFSTGASDFEAIGYHGTIITEFDGHNGVEISGEVRRRRDYKHVFSGARL